MIINSDVVILGSGAAGCTAAIYAARAGLKTVLILGNQTGGQLTVTTDVENYPGFSHPIQGPWLVEEMQKQAENVGTKVVYDHIIKISKTSSPFELIGQMGDVYVSSAVIIATGAEAKWLGTEDEAHFRGYGVSGCATCDGFFYKNKDVIVIGGGNTAVEEALYLTHHVNKVFLVHRRDTLKAEQILQKRLFSHSKIEVIWNSTLEKIIGKENPRAVSGVVLKSSLDSSLTEMDVQGVFIAIGHAPNVVAVKDIIELDEFGYIKTVPGSTNTSVDGIFACGDVQDRIYRQAVTAAGTGCMAALDAARYIDSLKTTL